jgi:predicted MFS family arabinose efflux permease
VPGYSHHRYFTLSLLAGSLLVIAVSMFVIPISAPVMTVDGLTSAELLAIVGSSQWIGALASTMATPALISHFGPARVCATGPACAALAMLCFAWPSPLTLVLGGLLIGLAIGPEVPASAEVLRQQLPPHHQASGLNLKQAAMPLGAILAGAATPALIATAGFQATALACAAVAAVHSVLMFTAMREHLPLDARRRADRHRGTLLRTILNRQLRAALCISALSALALAVVNTFLVLVLMQEHALSVAFAGLALAAAQSGALIGRLAAAALGGRRRGEHMVFIWSAGSTALGLGLLLGSQDSWLILTASALLGAGVSSNSSMLVLIAQRCAPGAGPGAAVSAAMFCNFLACSAAPAAFALAQKSIGIAATFSAFVAVGAMASMAAAVRLRRSISLELAS